MKLFGYWRSSASYRVRIALALKGLDYDYEPVNLLKGEQKSDAYLANNPTGLVPTLATNDGEFISQSLAIIDYLEEIHPEPTLLPGQAAARAHTRAIAMSIACEAQPFMNLRMQKYLKTVRDFDDTAMNDWLNRWSGGTMAAVEEIVEKTGGDYCVGDTPSLADCCLVPQMFGALRFGVDVSAMPRLNEIYERCLKHSAFQKAHPDNQPDAAKG